MKKPELGLLPTLPVTKLDSPDILRVLAQEKKPSKNKETIRLEETNRKKQATKANVTRASLDAIAKYTHSRIDLIEQIFEAHPDIELAAQTLVSSILSPNDLFRTNLFFKADVGVLPAQVTFALNSFVQKEIKTTHKLENDLYDIVKESYITKGAFCKLFIPSTKLVELVNLSTASVESEVSALCSPLKTRDRVVNNALANISLTNDTSVLMIADNIADAMSSIDVVTTEAIGDAAQTKRKQSDIMDIFNAHSDKKSNDNLDMTSYTVDNTRGLVMRLPMESVVPLHFTNDISKHFGYFILLDGKGSPILGSVQESDKNEIKTMMSNLVSKAKENVKSSSASAPKIPNSDEVLSQAIDAKLTNGIRNKIGGAYVSDDDKETLYRIVLDRALKDLKTRLLYVPASQLTYYAFNYRPNGTGKPILEGLSTISSLRTMLRFAKISALIRNSIPNTEVDVTLDDNDPDAPKTMESIRSYIMNTRSLSLPVGLSKTSDIVDWLHKYGFSFTFKHADLPDMSINTSEKSISHVVPDTETEDELKRTMYMKMGLSPETVENTKDADFAATVVANNALQARRISRIQMKLNPLITKDVVRYIKYDGYINSQVKHILTASLKIIEKNMNDGFNEALDAKGINKNELVEFLFENYINGLDVTLPKVEIAEDGSKEAFDNYKESLDDYIEMFFSEDALPEDFAGDLSDDIDTLQQSIKNSLLRRWMRENGYMEDLASVFETDDTGEIDSSVLDEYNIYISNIAKAMKGFRKQNKRVKKSAVIKEEDDPDDLTPAGGEDEGNPIDDPDDPTSAGDEGDPDDPTPAGGEDEGDPIDVE